MGTKAVEYYTNDCLDCGVLPQEVELCVPSSILAQRDCPAAAGEDDFTFHTLTASLVKCDFLGQCASQKFKYTFTYDDTQIAEDQVFTAAMITGSFCKGCFAQWVEDQVGNEPYIRNNEDGTQDFISPHGCAYRVVTGPGSITVDDTPSIDMHLSSGIITADSKLSSTSGNQVSIEASGLYVPKAAGLVASDTATVDLTLSSGTLTGDVKISADGGNEITAHADGIYAPTAAAALISAVDDTTTVDLTVTSGTLTADAQLSADPGNTLSIHGDGLYGAPGAVLSVADTSTVDLTLSGGGALSGTVKVSSDGGNIISAHSDGVYATASASFISSITDTATVDLTVSGGAALSADVKVSADSGNNIVAHGDGIYAPGLSALASNELFIPNIDPGFYQVSGSKAQLFNPNKFFSAGSLLWWMDPDNQQQMVSTVPGPPPQGSTVSAFFSNDGERFLFELGGGDASSWQGYSNTSTPPRRRGALYSTGTNPNLSSTDAPLIAAFNGATKICVVGIVQISTAFAFRKLVGLLGAASAEILVCGFDTATTVFPEMRVNIDLAHATTVTAAATGYTATKVTPIIYEWDLAAATASIWMNNAFTSVHNTSVSIAGSFNSALLQTIVLQVYINATYFYEHFVWRDGFMDASQKTAFAASVKSRYGNVTY